MMIPAPSLLKNDERKSPALPSVSNSVAAGSEKARTTRKTDRMIKYSWISPNTTKDVIYVHRDLCTKC